MALQMEQIGQMIFGTEEVGRAHDGYQAPDATDDQKVANGIGGAAGAAQIEGGLASTLGTLFGSTALKELGSVVGEAGLVMSAGKVGWDVGTRWDKENHISDNASGTGSDQMDEYMYDQGVAPQNVRGTKGIGFANRQMADHKAHAGAEPFTGLY